MYSMMRVKTKENSHKVYLAQRSKVLDIDIIKDQSFIVKYETLTSNVKSKAP